MNSNKPFSKNFYSFTPSTFMLYLSTIFFAIIWQHIISNFQFFLEQVDSYCVDYIIDLDIQDQLLKYNHKDFFTYWIYVKIINILYPFKLTMRKVLGHCPTTYIICIKSSDVFTFFRWIIFFSVFVFCLTKSFRDVRNSSSESFFNKITLFYVWN